MIVGHCRFAKKKTKQKQQQQKKTTKKPKKQKNQKTPLTTFQWVTFMVYKLCLQGCLKMQPEA